ncbi:hypothetical protein M406DRAFT_95762 [Cryphonectria parasitica EP155]|uniref:Uncharacterized protein n=1 Tax=Cryphonectria parasitica (strain ATCC 38755 / EP155) TaxID=660469 RepID=A0A9P5CJT1_CRYP1|nr:uncharacterized protein M406DRAFT_95762 [Cryphonectria parasitica EP155]KAF3760236.1 hypothetical protein M406DRAFT_95762 [Cryphonectria parasitica EP155]
MSAHASPAPSTGPTPEADESTLPQGNCRYIMLVPEIKGNRCACVNFTLNKSRPGATCECGHLACFHHRTSEPPIDKQELVLLRQRVRQLEELLLKGSDKENEVIQRVSELEGVVETRTEEMSQEIKKTYGNINRAWHSIEELERRTGEHDHRFRGVGGHLKNVDDELHLLRGRQCELNDAELNLEERFLELVESIEDGLEDTSRRASSGASQRRALPPVVSAPSAPARPSSVQQSRPVTSAASEELWTVHVSLLPSNSLPFPFERHTNAYKRCLSRGLHQMVAVNGTSSDAFVSAVSQAFSRLLKNRPWVPLQAKLCDAESLQGLPMLRPLDPMLVGSGYDVDFLRSHCAVLDTHGKIDSLYIAMQHSTLSWHALRHSPIFLPGLEASWEHDPMLDVNAPFDDDENVDDSHRPSAGDLVGVLPNLKRAASEISRSSSFGASTAPCDGPERPSKVPRTPCPVPNIHEDRRQRVGTA